MSTKPKAAPALAPATDAAKPMPKRAKELIAAAKDRKLTKDEIGELRTFRLKKDGTPIKTHEGPRVRSAVNEAAVRNVIEFAGLDGLRKMHERHGKGMRRAFSQHLKSLAEGSDDRKALETLARVLFPSQRRGFTKRDSQTVSKTGRVAILVSEIAAPGATVKREVVTLPDGRVGLFVYAAPATSTAAPAWAAGAAA